MGKWMCFALLIAATFAPASMWAQQSDDEAAIRAVLNAQVVAWNAGDIEGFMHAYEDSPRTTFIGKTVRHGYSAILTNYKSMYADKAKRGTLIFLDLDIRMLSPTNAVATGKFKLTFPDSDAATQSGIFSLVWAKTAAGWQIVLDHTSPTS